MDLDREFYRLIHKYDLDNEYPMFWDRYAKEDAINEMFSRIDAPRVALRCAGKHTEELYRILTDENREKVSYVIDDRAVDNSKFPKWSIIDRKTAAKNQDILPIVISTYIYEKEIMLELLGRETSFLSIYDYLRQKGLDVYSDFYSRKEKRFTYTDIWILRKQYEKTQDEIYLRRVIFACLMIRDFVSVEKYISEYKSRNFCLKKKYEDFWDELETLFENIKNEIAECKIKHIIINWVDAVKFDDAENMEVFSKDSGILLKNSFDVIPYTGSVLNSIFTGKSELLNPDIRKRKYNWEDEILLREISQRGYTFKYVSYMESYLHMFEDDMKISLPACYSEFSPQACANGCSTALQWELLKELAVSSRPTCFIVHCFAETHLPLTFTDMNYFIPGDIFHNPTSWNKHWKERYYSAIDFWDKQLLWYRKFYNPNAVQIFMTDHGPTSTAKNYEDDRCRTTVKIVGLKNRRNAEENRLFSFMNFWRLICYCIDEDEDIYESMFSNHVILEALDIYNKAICEIMEQWIDEESEMVIHIPRYLKYRAVKTNEELYVKYACGPELFFFGGKRVKNISDEKYVERVARLRKIVGDDWIGEPDNTAPAEKIYKRIDSGSFVPSW